MTVSSAPRLTKRVLLVVIVGLAVLVLYLYYFIGTANIASVITRTNPLWYSFAFLAFMVSVIFYALGWRDLLKNLDIKIDMRQVLQFSWAGMFLDSVVPDPGWSGDLSKAYMLSKWSGEEPGRIVASVVSQKIIVTVTTIVSLIFGLALLTVTYAASGNVLVFVAAVLVLTVSSLSILLYLSYSEKATKRILGWLIRVAYFLRRGKWNPEGFKNGAEHTLKRFHQGIRTLRSNPKGLALPVIYTLLAWVFDISITFLAFAALGIQVPLDKVLIVYALTGSLQAMGVSFIGSTEVIISGAYVLLGIAPAYSALATLLTRVVTLWFKLIVSYFIFQRVCIKLISNDQTAKNSILDAKNSSSQVSFEHARNI